jgi:4'-phosphopantetheinyl transferase
MADYWRTPPDPIEITPDDGIHVWAASLLIPDETVAAYRALLAPDELARADRFKFPRHRRRFIASQAYVRQILGRYLRQPPATVTFARTERGKPFLPHASAVSDLRFNVSHSHEMAVYAVILNHEIGIDIERLRPMPDAAQIAARFFSASEQAALLDLPPEERNLGFFRCWTRKEAFIKAIGQGLYHPLDHFSVSLAPDAPAGVLAVYAQPTEAERWSLREFQPASDYVGALAVRAPITQISYWRVESCTFGRD